MGRKLDLSGLSNNEAEHVLQVVQRDMRLRKKEEERLSELKQALEEEGDRCLLLSRQRHFNQRCCIRCCAPFGFLLNPKRRCHDCLYNVCKACRVFSKADKAWLCCSCQKSRLVKKQSLDWFYTHVKGRFKRFGSAKVLKTIYRRHLSENSPVSELAEGSAYEDSVCESDAAFYTQTEEHSVAETLTVALRVAEEAIDEAISNAEFDACQENQNEVHYLREHRGELIEELAKTIMQKIIARRENLAGTKDEYKQERSLQHNVHHPGVDSLQRLKGLWRSQSAFSLMDDNRDARQTSPKDGGGSSVSSWTSVERFENSGGLSSVLKSQDGNWIALQSAQLSRPSLLARRKSLVYSALERESGAISAYEGMDSDNDNEVKSEPGGSWGAILQEFQRKLTSSQVRRDADNRKDAEEKPVEKPEVRRPSSYRSGIVDINFNGKAATEESAVGSQVASSKAKRSRKKRRSKRRATLSGPLLMDFNRKDIYSRSPSDGDTPGTLTPDLLYQDVDMGQGDNEVRSDTPPPASENNSDSAGEVPRRAKNNGDPQEKETGSRDPEEGKTEVDLAGWREEDVVEEEEGEDEVEMRLYKLVARSRLAYFSSTDDDLDRAGRGQEEQTFDGEGQDGEVEGLTHKLCRLEKEAQSTVLSSTEDELDRVTDEENEEEEDGEGEEDREELAVRVCRLANQAGATQFSSTEDELDREEADDEELWRLRDDEAAQVTRVRHLASLVSASQFSSTEDELDRVGKDEGETSWREEPVEPTEEPDDDELTSEEETTVTIEERDRPEAKRLDLTGTWVLQAGELAEAGGAGSESDDEEMDFDKIISGMLTMTLEDMREENGDGKADEDRVTDEEDNDEAMGGRLRKEPAKTDDNGKEETKRDEDTKTDGRNSDMMPNKESRGNGYAEIKMDREPDHEESMDLLKDHDKRKDISMTKEESNKNTAKEGDFTDKKMGNEKCVLSKIDNNTGKDTKADEKRKDIVIAKENARVDGNKDVEMEKKTESVDTDQDVENDNDAETAEERNDVAMTNMEKIEKSKAEDTVNEDLETGKESGNEKSVLKHTEKERRDVTMTNVEGNENTKGDDKCNEEVKTDNEMENEQSVDAKADENINKEPKTDEEGKYVTMSNVKRNEDTKTDQDVNADEYRADEKKVDLEVFEKENGTAPIDMRTQNESTENNPATVIEGKDEMDKNAETKDDNAKTRNEDTQTDQDVNADEYRADEKKVDLEVFEKENGTGPIDMRTQNESTENNPATVIEGKDEMDKNAETKDDNAKTRNEDIKTDHEESVDSKTRDARSKNAECKERKEVVTMTNEERNAEANEDRREVKMEVEKLYDTTDEKGTADAETPIEERDLLATNKERKAAVNDRTEDEEHVNTNEDRKGGLEELKEGKEKDSDETAKADEGKEKSEEPKEDTKERNKVPRTQVEERDETETGEKSNQYTKTDENENQAPGEDLKMDVKTGEDKNESLKANEALEDWKQGTNTRENTNVEVKTDEEMDKSKDGDGEAEIIGPIEDSQSDVDRKEKTETTDKVRKENSTMGQNEADEDNEWRNRPGTDMDRNRDVKTDNETRGDSKGDENDRNEKEKTENVGIVKSDTQRETEETRKKRDKDEAKNSTKRKKDLTDEDRTRNEGTKADESGKKKKRNTRKTKYTKTEDRIDEAKTRKKSDKERNQVKKDLLRTPSPATAGRQEPEGQDGSGNPSVEQEDTRNYSAASLCSISGEVLKVLNATEELLQGVEGREGGRHSGSSFPANADRQKLDQRFSTLEEKVDVAAGSVYGVEAELGELDERAGGISGRTSHPEFSSLEERVTSAAARVQQSEQQIGDISARIAALRSAGLHVDPQSRLAKARTVPVMPLASSASRPLRRRLPALPRPVTDLHEEKTGAGRGVMVDVDGQQDPSHHDDREHDHAHQ
ncbi:uncharacterized protein myripa isoform X2 [Stigmatopora argus]